MSSAPEPVCDGAYVLLSQVVCVDELNEKWKVRRTNPRTGVGAEAKRIPAHCLECATGVWLEGRSARRSAATMGNMTAAATCLVVGKLDQLALATALC